ncbi:MAG: aminopeptidase P family N-terminal domain-containing protein, partial [Chloroflexota bacterium]|nr:aminopeptidase P family N-terminal domain-containing protein [Chloroflexota bacterium]
MTNEPLLNRSRAQRILDREGVDGLLASTFENVYYLSNLWVENFFVLPRQTQAFAIVAREKLGQPVVVAGIGEVANFAQACPPTASLITFGRFFRFVEEGSSLDSLAAAVKDRVIDHLDESKASVVDALAAGLEQAGLTRATVAYD